MPRLGSGFRRIGLPLFAALVLLGSACDMMPQQTGMDIEKTGGEFLERLRWQDYQGAARYMTEDVRKDFLDRMSLLKDLKVVDTRMETIEFTPGNTTAQSRGSVEYYLLPSITIQTLILEQEWVYQPATRTEPGFWLITTPFPEIPAAARKK